MNNDADKTRLISLAEAADLYGFNRNYLGILAKKGRLKAHKIGNMWLTTPADLEKYIQSREQKGAFRTDIVIDN
jgi:excisionase family DNA binding protein